FAENIPKYEFVQKSRIVCQQISNINKEQRLSFGLVPENFILANSCNFITVEENDNNITLYYLLGLLNSKLLNWYFKLFSSNNHINNYELDMLPIPIKEQGTIKRIASLAKQRMDVNDPEELDFEINKLVENLFLKDKEEGLTEHDIKQVSNRSNDSFKILDSQKKWDYLDVSINNLYT